ncbi:protein mono-ADP-ribosyltransferase TIPARP-like [Pempheris klunzingeri]|uniref:protein mono-ADP-ribosyltransferase TIPARP-like n=1 Tax=Pempheris klunzingeri TaxID=3127111 RepID=UPI0039813C55
MSKVSSTRGTKRKLDNVLFSEQRSNFSKVTLLSPSLLLLEIPADTNTSLPVWEAIRSQQLDIAWTVHPYSVSVRLTPVSPKQGMTPTSCRRESTSSVVQIPAPSSGLQQPQVVIQSVTQQHGASQNASCLLLTFSPNETQPRPSPNPSTSLIVPLPVIITQPQPALQCSTPTKNELLPTIQTPTATLNKPPPPSIAPDPSPFHTKSSSDTRICDKFLLGWCRAVKKCKMHHTPHPFHWQLRCMMTHQWVDIPPRSQVLLERIYCDVSQDNICIKDGHDHFTLDFDSMQLDYISRYDGVRRLTNSDSLVRNPYFPSKWKIYWRKDFNWEEYNTSVSTWLLKNMSGKESGCSFYIGSQAYKLNFATMTQTNVTTGFKREVRCRPVYRSPDSMQPYLQTGTQAEPTEPASDPPPGNFDVDPLEESSSWYPPVWCLASEQDCSLVDVPAGTQAYRRVQNLFFESLPETKVDVVSIQQVQNLLHWDKYQRHKAYMQKQHAQSEGPLEKHLFHGTTKEASEDICHNNFDPRMAGVNGTFHGFGTYFATAASFSNTFTARWGPDEVRHMFLAKVLVGRVSLGMHSYRRPPPLSSDRNYCLYDTCVDNVDKPSMFVVFDSCQCYPYYLIRYKDLPKEIDL